MNTDIFGDPIVVIDNSPREEDRLVKVDLFKDIIGSINTKSGNVIDKDSEAERAYAPFVVNKAFMMSDGTEMFAQTMNLKPHLESKLQYDFYYYGLPKVRGRFGKWKKHEDINNLDKVIEYYGCSTKKAREYLAILSEEQLAHITKRLYKGQQ